MIAAGMSGDFTVSQSGKGPAGQGLAGGVAVGVIAGQQQGAQPAGLCGAGCRDFLARTEQDTQCLPVSGLGGVTG
jgi:hypothetical protein